MARDLLSYAANQNECRVKSLNCYRLNLNIKSIKITPLNNTNLLEY